MMPFTDVWSLPYPDYDIANDMPYDLRALAEAVDASITDALDTSAELRARENISVVTSSIAHNATWTGTVTLAAGYRLLRIETDKAARVRLYDSISSRTGDASRAIGTDPTPPHGVILDFVTTSGVLSWWLSPVVDGYTADAGTTVPLSVTNMSGSTGAVTLTLTWVRSE